MNNFTAYRGSPLRLLPGQTVAAEGFTARWTGGGRLSEWRASRCSGSTCRPRAPAGRFVLRGPRRGLCRSA